MSQNMLALIIFLLLVALAVVGTLIFSALVDRSTRRERARVERLRTDYRGASSDSTRSGETAGSGDGDDPGGGQEESR